MSVRIGYMPGAFPARDEGVNFFRSLIRLGEERGYDSLWLSDRLVGERLALEPIVALSMVAAYSEKMKFGTSVLQLPIRNPVVLAKELATLDYLSNGRCLPAIGLGQENPLEYEACGVSQKDKGRRTDESIKVMRRLWQEDDVTHEGEFYSLHNVTINPKPVQTGGLPLWIGGRSRAAQQRVGRIGDGWLVSAATPQEIEDGVQVVFATASEFGREIEPDHIGALVTYNLASSREEAEEAAQAHVLRNRPEVHFTEYSALGTPDQVKDVLQSYIQAGAPKLVVRPACAPQETISQLDLFAREVLPHFHK